MHRQKKSIGIDREEKVLKILIAEAHPILIVAYKAVLENKDSSFKIEITERYDSMGAYNIITSKTVRRFDAFIVDGNLSPFPEKSIYSGDELALLFRRHFPEGKLIYMSSNQGAVLIYEVVKRVDPEGLLVKSDFDGEELLLAFETVLNGDMYHSRSVKNALKVLTEKKTYLDRINRKILILLSHGVKTKNISGQLYLSLSAIEKRKAEIKDYFGIEKGTDEDILREAKRQRLL